MISSLRVEERVSRSHLCGVDVLSVRTNLACSIHLRRLDQQNTTGLTSFSPQKPLRRPAFEAALRRTVLFNINQTFLEA